MKSDDLLLWVDLETTGLSPKAELLEIGLVVTLRNSRLTTLDAFTDIIRQPCENWDDEAYQMHVASGLIPDITLLGRSLHAADNRLQDFILQWFPDPSEKITLAGSGIHYDKPYIERDFPWLAKRLNYWFYDVSPLRRWSRLRGVYSGIDQKNTPHRALDDLFQHIREARVLMEHIA